MSHRDAEEFFVANPNEPYWYYSPTLRVPNPKLNPWTWSPRVPWPTVD